MKKELMAASIFMLLLIAFGSAANTTANVSVVSSSPRVSEQTESSLLDKAYRCLDGQIANKTSLSLPEAVFGMLALGSKQNLLMAIQSAKHDREACWPKQSCKIKDTAQVLLAYRHAGIPTADIEQWLLSKKAAPAELAWYLEIDSVQHEPAACTVRYDGREHHVAIAEDMTLSGGAGSCLSISNSGYWLRIATACTNKSFEISCDKDFVTTLVYQKTGGETVYVLPTTHSAPSLGTTNESVSVGCFKSGAACDYEGTLWATFALQSVNRDVSYALPYLTALAEDNRKYFPSSFLYGLTSDEEYFSDIIQSRKQGQFWEFTGNGYNRFYDTSVGMLALGSSSSADAELEKTRQYLLQIQTREGCWNNNNIRDTGFILYAGWPRGAAPVSARGGTPACTEAGYSCEQLSACTDAGGIKKEGYECPALSICCSQKVERQSCSAENGHLCAAGQECDVATFEASDGACCLGSCREAQQPGNQCEQSGGTCREQCSTGEEPTNDACSGASVCCGIVQKKSGGWAWIVVLIILILIVIAAIAYRNALRVWWFKHRGRASSSPVMRPSSPPPGGGIARPMRQIPRSAPPRSLPPRTQAPRGHDELEETLKKLREMSK